MTTDLATIPPSLLSWIRDYAKLNPSWNEASLRRFLSERGSPCPEILVDWERSIHALGEERASQTHYLLELSDSCFGTLATGAGQARLPDGAILIVIGRFIWGGALGMDERGRLFISKGDGWVPLAEHPAIHLARLALVGMATEEMRLHLVILGREHAVRLADPLGLAEVPAACDGLQRFWQAGAILLHQGDLDAPTASISHVFVGAGDVRRVVEACSALGVSGALAHRVKAPTIAPLMREEATCPHPTRFRHRPRNGRGGGWVALRDGSDPPVVEEVCFVDGHRVSEVEWPSGHAVEYARPWVDGLSEEGSARLLRHGFRRDFRRTCTPAELDALLARHGLPSYPAVHAIERQFGGLRCPLREGAAWLSFGTFGVLAFEDEAYDHASWAADSADLEDGADWPRVRLDGELLVPVGSDVEATFYVDHEGTLLRHDWIMAEVHVMGRDLLGYLERRLLTMEVQQRTGGSA